MSNDCLRAFGFHGAGLAGGDHEVGDQAVNSSKDRLTGANRRLSPELAAVGARLGEHARVAGQGVRKLSHSSDGILGVFTSGILRGMRRASERIWVETKTPSGVLMAIGIFQSRGR